MSSFLDESVDRRKKGVNSELNHTNKEKDIDLFPHSNTGDDKNIRVLSDMDVGGPMKQAIIYQKPRGGTSNRKYRKQSKNKFKVKNIETDFQLQRNDPLLNLNNFVSNKNATNQTMQMFVSSNVGSPAMSNMGIPPNFVLASATKNSKLKANCNKRPVSAVMAKRLSPHSSVDLPMFDLKRMRPSNIKRDKLTLYDDAMKLKKANNTMMDENIKLKTNLQKLESE
jgi:hypothetical protein